MRGEEDHDGELEDLQLPHCHLLRCRRVLSAIACAAEEAAKVSLSQRQDVVRCRAAEDAECGSAPIPGRLPGCTDESGQRCAVTVDTQGPEKRGREERYLGVEVGERRGR